VDQGYPLCEIREINEAGSQAIPMEIKEKRRELVLKKRRVTSLISSVFDYYQLNNDITQTIISVLSSAHRNSLLTVSDIIRMIETDIESSTVYPVDSFLNRQAVTIQTIHKSKGLEYPVVIVAGFNKNSFPSTKGDSSEYIFNDLTGIRSKSQVCPIDGNNFNIMSSWKTKLVMRSIDKDYSEERRLLFVAISRAKQYVTITSYSPSSFFLGLSEGTLVANSGKEKVCLPYNEYSEATIDPPVIKEFTKRRRNIGVHDILRFEGENAPPEGSDQVCGKGMEYGIKVHHAAELMARGIQLDNEYSNLPEIEEIRKVLDSVKDAVYLESEIECALPFNDVNTTLRGIIDLYAEFSDHVEIHDYKTDVSDMFEDEYKMQLSVYAHAAAEVTGKKVSCIIDYVSQGRSVAFSPLDKRYIEARLADYS
jgi:ATP-dependent helicase/nuclease subunit A